MSDTVDDLEVAEQLASTLADALRDLLAGPSNPESRSYAAMRLREFDAHCRPTCGWLRGYVCPQDPNGVHAPGCGCDEPECESGDTCGCQCDHPGQA